MARGSWLLKSEPELYPFAKLVADGGTFWEGVRNYSARNHLRAMKKGDLVLFYHSHDAEIVGVAKVAREAYQDPSTDDERWVAVDLVPVKPLAKAVPLAKIKQDRELAKLPLVKQSRLSVMPVSESEFAHILELAGTKLAGT